MNVSRAVSKFFSASLVIMVLCQVAVAAESYRFERMFPTLQQPWYFGFGFQSTVDERGSVFVLDSSNSRIVKLNSRGRFITSAPIAPEEFSGFNTYYLDRGFDGKILVLANAGYPGFFGSVLLQYDENLNYLGHIKLEVTVTIVVGASDFVAGPDHVYFYDATIKQVYKFARDGAWENQIHMQDSGSEFYDEGIALDADDNLVYFDAGRIELLEGEGQQLKSVDVETTIRDLSFGSRIASNSVAFASDDSFFVCNNKDLFHFEPTG